MILKRGLSTCAISEVKGHADDDMVRRGRVRPVDKIVMIDPGESGVSWYC